LIAAVVVLFLVHLARTSDGRFRAVLPLALVSAGVGAFIIVPLIGGAELLGKSSDLSGRTDIWQFAATMIERNPWLGYGYKVFWLGENAPAAPFWKASRNFVPHAHDGYLETTLDVGLIGLSLYLAAAVSLAIKSIRILQRRVDTLFLWIVGYLVFSLIVNIGEVRLWEANDLHTILFIFAVVHTNKEFSSILGRVPAKSKVTARAFEQSTSPVPSVEISR